MKAAGIGAARGSYRIRNSARTTHHAAHAGGEWARRVGRTRRGRVITDGFGNASTGTHHHIGNVDGIAMLRPHEPAGCRAEG